MNIAAMYLGSPVAFIVASIATVHGHMPVLVAVAIGVAAGFACGRALLRAIKGSGPQRH